MTDLLSLLDLIRGKRLMLDLVRARGCNALMSADVPQDIPQTRLRTAQGHKKRGEKED